MQSSKYINDSTFMSTCGSAFIKVQPQRWKHGCVKSHSPLCIYFQLSVAHTEDWTRFARTLMEIRANRADGEEEGPMELAS